MSKEAESAGTKAEEKTAALSRRPTAGTSRAEIAERRAYFKREARETLLFGGNWLPVIFSFLVLLFFTVGIKYLHETVFFAAELTELTVYSGARLEKILRISGDVFLFFGVSPLLPGIYAYLASLYSARGVSGAEKAIRVGDIFVYFGSFPSLCEAYRLVFAYVWRTGAAYFAVRALSAVWIRLRSGFGSLDAYRIAAVSFLFTLLGAAAAALLLWALMRINCLWYCACCRPNNRTVREAYRESAEAMRGHSSESLLLVLSFALWGAFSLLTAGALLLFAVPYFLLTHISFCSYAVAAAREIPDAAVSAGEKAGRRPAENGQPDGRRIPAPLTSENAEKVIKGGEHGREKPEI